jgi:hypothetical protein
MCLGEASMPTYLASNFPYIGVCVLCVVCCLRRVHDDTYILLPFTVYSNRCANLPLRPFRVYDQTQDNTITKTSQTPRMWFYSMPLVLIKDEDLTYHGKTLSARYEEGRLRAIHTITGTDDHQGRPRVRSNLIVPD